MEYTKQPVRWIILSLMFVATTINYRDYAIVGVLLPEIRKQIHIGTDAYRQIALGFQIEYGIGSLIGGKRRQQWPLFPTPA